MTSTEFGIVAPARVAPAVFRLILAAFASTLFLSALLLFAVQPMFAKMVLPILGGSPSVWSVAMVFFQALLLAGYGYAHLLARHVELRVALAVHLAVMAIAFFALPVAVATGWGRAPLAGEAFWLLGLFLVSVGLPFFAVAGNGPLLQAWFARSGHPQAQDPYFLYGASNVGSFAALIAYPLLVEPILPLSEQSRIWTIGFCTLAVGIMLCGLLAARAVSGVAAASFAPRAEASSHAVPTWRDGLAWVGLAFVPSGLLVSVTAHISTDVAAVPLMWVVPLALFLATFVLVFRTRPLVSMTALAPLQIWATAYGLANLGVGSKLAISLITHLGLFFIDALVCHTALYQRRPPAANLTSFYLMMSLGGVLGGIFSALVAPQIFASVLEYPILMVAAVFYRPGFAGALRTASRMDMARVGALGILVLCGAYAAVGTVATVDHVRLVLTCLVAGTLMLNWRNAGRVAVLVVVGAFAMTLFQDVLSPRQTYRSFFGVMKVREVEAGRFRTLEHGTTLHGAVRIRNDDGTPYTGPIEPTTYYTADGPIGEAIAAVRATRGGLPNLSVIGLGVGALACHIKSGETLTFYEIDPLVVRLATDPSLFKFLSDCAPRARIVIGDARLTIADQATKSDLIVVDAFSSDAIPVHLLTREAIALYLAKLTEHGVIVFHISNNAMDLRRTVAAAAQANALSIYIKADPSAEPAAKRLRTASLVAVMARDPADLGRVTDAGSGWIKIPAHLARAPWTDDYSNIFGPIIDKIRD